MSFCPVIAFSLLFFRLFLAFYVFFRLHGGYCSVGYCCDYCLSDLLLMFPAANTPGIANLIIIYNKLFCLFLTSSQVFIFLCILRMLPESYKCLNNLLLISFS